MPSKITVALTLAVTAIALLPGDDARSQSASVAPARDVRLWDVLPDGGGQPTSIAMDARGRIVVAQRNPAQVHVLDTTGRLLRSIGRQGRGPGEFLMPSAVLYGDSVLVWDGQLRRLSVFAIATGRVIREVTVRVSGTLLGVSTTGQIYMRNPMSDLERKEEGVSVVRVSLGGDIIDTLQHRLRPTPAVPIPSVWRVKMTGGGGYATAIPFVPRPLVALHPAGHLIMTWPPSGVLQRLVPPATVQVVHQSDQPRHKIPSEQRRVARDSALAADASTATRAALASFYRIDDIPEFYPPWSRVEIDGMGRVVLTDPSTNTGVHRFVLLSPDGRSRTVTDLSAAKVGERRAWAGGWLATLVDGDEGVLLTLFRVR